MAYTATVKPNVLTDPGALFVAPVGTALIATTVAAGVFSADWSTVPAWVPVGATADGVKFSYTTSVEPIEVAEFLDPIQYATTGRSGNVEFQMANNGATNLQRALNSGAPAATPTSGTGATALYTVQPPVPGAEIRIMVGWESLDHTARFYCYQTIQGGDISLEFKKAPSIATVPVTFNMEIPTAGLPFIWHFAGPNRG